MGSGVASFPNWPSRIPLMYVTDRDEVAAQMDYCKEIGEAWLLPVRFHVEKPAKIS